MFQVKEFIDTCNNAEFYKYIGRFFAERIFRKELPYLIKDYEKIWYLITGKKNEYQELRYGSDIDVGNIK